MINRRLFLQGLVAGAAGILIPERKIWALDQTMITPVNPESITGGEVPWVVGPANDATLASIRGNGGWVTVDHRAALEARRVQEREMIYGDETLRVSDTRGWEKGDMFALGSGNNREYGVVTMVFPEIRMLTIKRWEYT